MSRDKRLSWRSANENQAMDKATIYNSREWRELRIAKLRSQPLCERCLSLGRYVSAHVVHHIIPIETAHTLADMKRLAIDCGLAGLQSLCDQCHSEIHNDAGYHTRDAVQQRTNERLERWQDKVMKRFASNNQETMQENKRLGIFGTLNYDKLKDMTMDERKLAVTNHAKDILTRKTKDRGPQIPEDDRNLYDITAEYTIIDYRYNKQGKILATFKAQRTDEDLTIEMTSFESVTT